MGRDECLDCGRKIRSKMAEDYCYHCREVVMRLNEND